MPNHCENKLELSHENSTKIAEIRDIVDRLNQTKDYENYGLFQYLLPIEKTSQITNSLNSPEYLTWGTKGDAYYFSLLETKPNYIEFIFVTDWTPPIPVYEKMNKLGYRVDALYCEPGVGFCGEYTNESGDCCFDCEWNKNKYIYQPCGNLASDELHKFLAVCS